VGYLSGTGNEDRRILQKYLAAWRPRELTNITRQDVRNLHYRIGREEGHPLQANRALAVIRMMLKFAIDCELMPPGALSTDGIKPFKEQRYEEYIKPHQLPAFHAAMQAEPDWRFRAIFQLLLYTGARRGEIPNARWADVDLGEKVIAFPITKSGRPRTQLLSPQALQVLMELPCATQDGRPHDRLFPGAMLGALNNLAKVPRPRWAAWVPTCTGCATRL